MSNQLSLSLHMKDGSSFSNFFAGSNAESLQHIRSAVLLATREPVTKQTMFLCGADGTGKSHLLQAACRLAQELGVAPVYVPLAEANQLSTSLLESVEQAPLVCLDDVERVAGHPEWEMALFSIIERLRVSGGLLISAACAPPGHLGLRLPDLVSRLAWGTVYALHLLSDTEKLQAVRLRAHNRGFDMPEDVAHFILSRYPRDMHSLFDLLDRIDRAALAQQRRVTIPFLRQLEQMRTEGAESG